MSDSGVDVNAPEEQLRRVQAVTEATLAHLSLERLLEELLLRVRDLLHADTAAVLLLDEERRELVATAAKGIEEEVEQGVRLPLGSGFAGRIAASGQPVVLPVVEHGKVLNPLLLKRGIKSLLGVPLIVDGSTVGVLHVGTLVPRTFTDADVALLQLVADRVALAVRARREEGHRLVAEALQRSLLPERIPPTRNVEVSVRYVPAHGGMIGGDWYDVFPLPNGALGVAVGDIVGRGLDAAIQMGRLRNVLRAFALQEANPSTVVGLLNQHLLHFDSGVVGSLLYALIGEDGEMTYANAGHMPPLIVRADGDARFAEEPGEPILGAAAHHAYRDRHLKLDEGSTLLLYTDGLVERRGVSLDVGLEHLRRVASGGRWATLEQLCDAVVPAEERLEDDLAVLSLRYVPETETGSFVLTLHAYAREMPRLRATLRRWLRALDASPQATQDVLVAVSEAAANAIEHAYGPAGGRVEVAGRATGDDVEVSVRDHGRWREPRGRDRGRGHILIRALMDEAEIVHGDDGTTVTMRKRLGDDS